MAIIHIKVIDTPDKRNFKGQCMMELDNDLNVLKYIRDGTCDIYPEDKGMPHEEDKYLHESLIYKRSQISGVNLSTRIYTNFKEWPNPITLLISVNGVLDDLELIFSDIKEGIRVRDLVATWAFGKIYNKD